MRRIIKKLLPPVAFDIKHAIWPPKRSPHEIVWRGDYASWRDAAADSTGYDADIILAKTVDAITKVKNNEAVYERDSVLFDKPDYSWPLLALLLKIGAEKENVIKVADFGGSIGSSYFQNRNFLKPMKLQWSVVEQEHYIAVGNQKFADDQLKFYYTIEDCIKERKPDVLLLSGVIQCVDEPYGWLKNFIGHNFEYIIFDRTAFTDAPKDRLTVQEVPASIYTASYPAWFFNYDHFISFFKDTYDVAAEFDSHAGFVATIDGKTTGFYKGFMLKRKS